MTLADKIQLMNILIIQLSSTEASITVISNKL